MARPLIVPLPPNLDLADGVTVRVTALDPDTGDTMAGVNVRNVTLEVDKTGAGNLDSGPFMLVTGPQG